MSAKRKTFQIWNVVFRNLSAVSSLQFKILYAFSHCQSRDENGQVDVWR